jgi:polysaccharide chain length determinant protein (PEP-CTERM system associated)
MSDLLKELLIQIRGGWRYRWPAVATAWVIALAAWVAIALIPNEYESRAQIHVDSDSVLKPLLSGLAVGTDVNARAATMSRMMLSRPNIERVAVETKMIDANSTQADREYTVEMLADSINIIRGAGDANLYTVSYVDEDPVLARNVVKAMLTAFVEDTLGVKKQDSNEAQKFLRDQIAEYEVRMRESEERLADFKRRNVGLMPGEAGDYYARLQAANTEMEAAQTEFRALSSKRDELMRQLEGEEPTVGIMAESGAAAGPASPLDATIAQHKTRLENLLLQYTEKHPEVISLRETLTRLEKDRADQAAARKRSGMSAPTGTNALNINPVYQSMRISLSQTELQLVDVRNRLTRAQGEVGKLRGLVNTVPEVEAELSRLNRDYEVTRVQHQQLLQRLESARITEQAEQSKDASRFQIVEPPTVPVLPTGVPRGLLATAALLAALGAGVLLALVLNQTHPVFSTRSQLATMTGLPVFGSVSYAPSSAIASTERRQPKLVFAAMGALIAVYAASLILSRVLANQ